MSQPAEQDLIWILTPFERPDPKPVIAAVRAGATGILDLGGDAERARGALATIVARVDGPFGVRVARPGTGIDPAELPAAVTTVVVGAAVEAEAWRSAGRRVVREVTSLDEAVAAAAAGVDGIVAKGFESGGRVGSTGAFVLLQQILTAVELPVWVQGGIGRHTAPAAVLGGAAGVVLDAQTSLLRESAVPVDIKAVISAMDGSETKVVGRHRIYQRPDLWVAALDARTTEAEVTAALGGDDLRTQAIPVGQDASFAASFARAYGTVGMAVAGLRRSILERVALARDLEPLAPGAGVAGELRTAYPVVQGPMTRVSDQSAFALSVAEGGGLPFLALALLSGPQVRELLEQTRDLLGDRPWGVGVLGFVPKELREQQLEVIREIKPPVALIAGGRPSQAAPLEADGITTFLHVPSSGLLERFLKDGARRFVFEGSECGGHVGPRPSFTLWEAQVETLLAFPKLDEVSVLFAGGIHDERSAAMVSALAAPLAARGAKVGVLMGTAYLFTEEAVAGGAITEEFQQQAIACRRTALLESGPGHATRCAETPFVDLFEQTRLQLHADGADPTVIWAELENLNLGRLRVASKGLKREGEEIVTVDRDEQRRDGMYMIGDVATMHAEVTTVAELHERVTAGAVHAVEQAGAEIEDRLDVERDAHAAPVDIAIVGMSSIMPGARDVEEFWHNIVNGINSITEVTPERFDTDLYFDPDWDHATAQRSAEIKSASKWGGFLPDVEFDALAYGIPPSSLAAIEPVQLLALKAATDALADAGLRDREFDRERTSVIFGAEGGTDQSAAHSLGALLPMFLRGDPPDELKAFMPKLTEDSFPGLLTNVIAGRIANRLDLGGKNMTVDAACASSLAALDVACAELVAGTSDTVLCGGADLHNGVHDFLLFTSVHALSTKGQCQTFDADADGIVLGEGVACVVLKRLADAERDGDRIYSVIKSVAGSSDGRSLGLTAPRQQGQERCVRRAYRQAGVSPADVGLIEAHGTGTVVGDRTEMATLTQSFSEAGAAPASCVLGSVKSNIGHTKCAAGLAGLVKAAKAVYHGVLPPTLNITHPNREWDADKSPFVFLDEARPWLDEKRIAGVSAFGFGGTNFHVILESYDDDGVAAQALHHWPSELFVFHGATEEDVDAALTKLAARLSEGTSPDRWRLRDAAAAVSLAGRGPVRLAIVATDVEDLAAKIAQAQEKRMGAGVYGAESGALEAGAEAPTVAFLFPGQGSQRPGMAGDLLASFPASRDVLRTGERFAATMLPAAAFTADARDEQKRAITDTRQAQPTLGIAGLAYADVLRRAGVVPALLGGHSYGELVALCTAGVFDAETLLQLSTARATAMLEAAGDDPGTMVAVSASRTRVDAIIDGTGVVVANDNHPEQLVLAGTTPAIEQVIALLKADGISAKRLPVAAAFHSPVVAAAADVLAARLDEVDLAAPAIPVYSNLSAGRYPDDAGSVRDLLSGQVANGVRFTDEIRAMHDAGARVFVEVGPGRVLTNLIGKILGDRPHLAVACEGKADAISGLLHALGQLAVAGVPIDTRSLFADRDVDPTRFTVPTKAANWTVNGHLVRLANGSVVPGGLKPANEAPRFSMFAGDEQSVAASFAGSVAGSIAGSVAPGAAPSPFGAGAGQPGQDQVLVQYFQAANQLISSGRDLMLNYLGVPSSAGVLPAPANVAVTPQIVAPAPASPMSQVGGGAAADLGRPPAVAPAPAAPAAPAGFELPTEAELLARLVDIVSLRTGYPADMLDPDLDVEADLSIDSIKRIEILGELAEQIGLAESDGAMDQMEDLVEELAQRKTLRGIVTWLYERKDLLGATGASGGGTGQPAGLRAAGAVGAPAGFELPTEAELLARLVEIVSLRTGYPADMLDPDLDVEADLSIDSIKRIEILGELAEQIGLADAADGGAMDAMEDLVEELAQRKTLRGIVTWLYERKDMLAGGSAPDGGGGAPSPAPEPAPERELVSVGAPAGGNGAATAEAPSTAPATAPAREGRPVGSFADATGPSTIPARAQRVVVALADAPLDEDAPLLRAATVAVCGSNPLSVALVDALGARDLDVRTANGERLPDGTDTVVITSLLDEHPPSIPELYGRLRELLVDERSDIIVVSGLGGGLGINPPAPAGDGDVVPIGAGIRGLVKTAAIEYPDRSIRLVDVEPSEPVARLAGHLADELAAVAPAVEVGWRDGNRCATVLAPATATVPDVLGEPDELGLTADSVVLLTGGARGITAQVALALGRLAGCHIELVGRSALPTEPEDPELAACPDKLALRTALIARGMRAPKEIEQACSRILAAREVRATLQGLEDAGSTVTYHPVDVRDGERLGAVIESIYERHGRLDGIVHGAGVLDDHFIADKDQAAFEQVFSTKVDAARTLLDHLRPGARFVVFFGSIAGVVGNRGQADYAAANDALDALAATHAAIANRVVSLDWGPWESAAGMVSEALGKIFEDNGMGLIGLDDGTHCLLGELAAPASPGGAPRHQVVVVRCAPALLAMPTVGASHRHASSTPGSDR